MGGQPRSGGAKGLGGHVPDRLSFTDPRDRPTDAVPSFFFLFARFRGILWKAARIGERLSPWVGLVCLAAGIGVLLR